MKAMSKRKWKKLSKEEIEFIKIWRGSYMKVAEKDFETLKNLYAIAPREITQSPFILGKYMYIATRSVEETGEDFETEWTYRLLRIPVKAVETMVVGREK